MRSKLALAVATALAAFFVGTGIMAAQGAGRAPETITFLSKTVQEHNVDLPPTQRFNLGDRFVFSDVLKQNGDKVGVDGGECFLAHRKPFRFECEATFRLSGRGQIAAQALFRAANEDKPFKISITGGTGEFSTARGYGVISPTQRNNVDRVTLYLVP